ncbi:hypothetical protein PHLGIDRAFT_256836 [Phlebiopsis gigantea 11061_1 CR5-6]|uniref:Uncharacterized protein n=1 Tax=Phlebiopsis gigantea (strain 11061_1 CR5-6) TaxID=745531 RepID=A0A0C3PCY5_PHLG1|nr:hypothetical protein PHLGIDRAFT_256836 [Phlebiopsis gigantea 11061_1 CR5-6]
MTDIILTFRIRCVTVEQHPLVNLHLVCLLYPLSHVTFAILIQCFGSNTTL